MTGPPLVSIVSRKGHHKDSLPLPSGDILSFPQTGFPCSGKASTLALSGFEDIIRTLYCLRLLLPFPSSFSLGIKLGLYTSQQALYHWTIALDLKHDTLKLPRSLCISGNFHIIRMPLNFTLSLLKILLCIYSHHNWKTHGRISTRKTISFLTSVITCVHHLRSVLLSLHI